MFCLNSLSLSGQVFFLQPWFGPLAGGTRIQVTSDNASLLQAVNSVYIGGNLARNFSRVGK